MHARDGCCFRVQFRTFFPSPHIIPLEKKKDLYCSINRRTYTGKEKREHFADKKKQGLSPSSTQTWMLQFPIFPHDRKKYNFLFFFYFLIAIYEMRAFFPYDQSIPPHPFPIKWYRNIIKVTGCKPFFLSVIILAWLQYHLGANQRPCNLYSSRFGSSNNNNKEGRQPVLPLFYLFACPEKNIAKKREIMTCQPPHKKAKTSHHRHLKTFPDPLYA